MLVEVEVARQVAQDLEALSHVGPGIGSPVRPGVEALPAQEVVLDERQVGVKAQDLVVDVALPGVGANHQITRPDTRSP